MARPARAPAAALAAFAVLGTAPARAEEGGTGHYLPGATASFIDALPKDTRFAFANFFLFYPASVSGRLPVAGLLTATLDATVFADLLVGLYRTELRLLGGSYAFGGMLPVLWTDLTGTIVAGAGTRATSESASGIGDVFLYPFLLGWTAMGGDLKYDVRFGIYAPTGKFEAGSIANVGKNYWTFEPAASVSFLSSRIGLEASAYAGFDFNTRNGTTDYLTGKQLHVDATVAEHLPLLGGLVGLGASAFYYQQVTADTGSGAVLGELKGRTVGVGPVASYAMKIGDARGALEVKWLPELQVKNRIEGDYFWLKLGVTF